MIRQPLINFCKLDVMSICKADSKKQQQDCLFFEKSNCESRCMYFVFNEFCDNLNAQAYAGENRLTQ